MNLHEGICAQIQKVIDSLKHSDIISPSHVARELVSLYTVGPVDPHMLYAATEHYKQMARKMLSGRYDSESEENETHQGELFSGHLQTRYPVQHKPGMEPIYKRRGALTDEEVKWNVGLLRRSGEARLQHADALEAWGIDRPATEPVAG